MKPKTLVPLVIGLGVGFFAIKMGIDMVKKAKGSQEDTLTVVVSAKPIEAAQRITDKMISTRPAPKSLIPSDGFIDVDALVGRVTKMPVAAGVPITKAMLAPPGSEPGLAATIPPGFRAVSVKVNEESSVAGFIMTGSRVDVMTMDRSGDGTSRTALANVEVGAVGQSMSQLGPDGKVAKVSKTVTLFLRPEQVQTLNSALAKSRGNVRLAMRGHQDDPGESKMADFFKSLMSGPAVAEAAPDPKPILEPTPVKVAKAPVQYHVVELRRGDEYEKLVFDERGGVRAFAGDQPLPPQYGGPQTALPEVDPEPMQEPEELEMPVE